MILITTFDNDIETQNVCKWLDLFGKKHKIETNFLNLFKKDYFDEISSIWFRKISTRFEIREPKLSFDQNFNTYLNEELIGTIPYLEEIVRQKKVLGNLRKLDLNKIESLNIAKGIGFKIPDFRIISEKREFELFIKVYGQIISKPITNIRSFTDINTKDTVIPYTSCFDASDVHIIPEIFYPSFVQQKINKKVELKVFYFYNHIEAISIYSTVQNEIIDLKEVLSNDPDTRISPYHLPEQIKMMIKKLFTSFNLNIGTIDFIVDDDENYFFLELNPSGQFHKIEQICNSNIYKLIAEHL